MPLTLVSTFERPDLVEITARWRWEAFFPDSDPFEDTLQAAWQTATEDDPLERTFVLLDDGEPVGTASMTAHDLPERPELSPWLAGVFVVPQARGQGHAGRLVAAVEQAARAAAVSTLWLYTNTAERIYARLGWHAVETVERDGEPAVLMRRRLQPRPPP